MRTNRIMLRQKLVLPLVLLLIFAGNIVLHGWALQAPRRLTAALTDLSGDRAALDTFPIALTLRSEQLAQDIRIENRAVSSSVRYVRGTAAPETVLPPLFIYDGELLPAAGADTTVESGFLPTLLLSYPNDSREGYIMTTDRAEIYLTGHVSTDSGDYFCIPSGMYLQSDEPAISIGYYYSNAPRDGSGSAPSRELHVYGSTFGPDRMDTDDYTAFYVDMNSVRCGEQVFFMPNMSHLTDSTSRGDVSFGGTCSLFRVVDTAPETDLYQDWPDRIQTIGAAQTVLSFPAQDCSLLALENIDDTYVFLAVYADRALHFYLLDPDGTVRDSYIAPLAEDVSDGLRWACDARFANRDSDGTPCRTLALTGSNETRESPTSVIVEVEQADYLTFRITDRLELVSRQPGSIAFDPALIAWRDGKLLVVDVEERGNAYQNSEKADISRFVSGYRTQVLLSVYGPTGCAYRGEVLTDINDQYCRTPYRRFTEFYLTDDPETLRQYQEVWYT